MNESLEFGERLFDASLQIFREKSYSWVDNNSALTVLSDSPLSDRSALLLLPHWLLENDWTEAGELMGDGRSLRYSSDFEKLG